MCSHLKSSRICCCFLKASQVRLMHLSLHRTGSLPPAPPPASRRICNLHKTSKRFSLFYRSCLFLQGAVSWSVLRCDTRLLAGLGGLFCFILREFKSQPFVSWFRGLVGDRDHAPGGYFLRLSDKNASSFPTFWLLCLFFLLLARLGGEAEGLLAGRIHRLSTWLSIPFSPPPP